jgi:hypothetical protein
MIEEDQQSNKAILPSSKPDNSWWPLFQFILLFGGSAFLFYIPVVILFFDSFYRAKGRFKISY